MQRLYLILTSVLMLAACAHVAPPAEPLTRNMEPVLDQEPPTSDSEIEVARIPEVSGPAVVQNRNERICRNERKTGTHRLTRVCRTRAEMEELEVASKQVFDELHKSQKEYEQP